MAGPLIIKSGENQGGAINTLVINGVTVSTGEILIVGIAVRYNTDTVPVSADAVKFDQAGGDWSLNLVADSVRHNTIQQNTAQHIIAQQSTKQHSTE